MQKVCRERHPNGLYLRVRELFIPASMLGATVAQHSPRVPEVTIDERTVNTISADVTENAKQREATEGDKREAAKRDSRDRKRHTSERPADRGSREAGDTYSSPHPAKL